MNQWSQRCLNQPLLQTSLPRDDFVDVSPFEIKFDWDIEESNIFTFKLKPLFLSDQFENLLGHRTYLLFQFRDDNNEIVGDFGFKVRHFFVVVFNKGLY